MNYLLIAIVVTVVLLALYLIARIVRPFGQALAFVCTVGSRINIKIVEYMNKAVDYCNKVCLASLRYPPGVSDSDYWPGINVMARLVYFVLAALILAGETVNTLLVLPALFHTANHIQLPGMIEIASAALFICTPALFGAVVFECCGLIPHGAGLFPRLSTLFRWFVGVLSGVCLILAILLTGYFYLFRAAYLVDPQSTQDMSLYILGGLGLLIAAVSVLALWALVVGGAGVVSLLMWIVEQVCRVIAGAASFLPHVLDVLAVHLSQGTISVHGDYIGHDPYKVPASPFSTSRLSSPGQTVTEDMDVIPVITTEMEKEEMSRLDKNASFVFVGEFGSRMLNPVTQKIATLRATESIVSSGYLDLPVTHVQTSIPGITDVTPPLVERKAAMLHGETEAQAYQTLLSRLGEKLLDTHLETKASPAPLIFVIDCHVLLYAVAMLESIKRRLPMHTLVVVTSVSAFDAQSKAVQTGFADMQRLHAEDLIETVIVTDLHSPFARKYGEETQQQFLAHSLVSLVIAHKHSLYNRSCTNVLQELHSLSAFTAVSFASEVVALGSVPKRWAWLPGVSGHTGTGNYSDIIMQTRAAINRTMTKEEARAFPAEVTTNTACTLLCSEPIALNDSRFSACVQDNALYIGTHYPFASALTVRGNGCPYPHHIGGKYLITATCLFPLQPATFPRLNSGTQVQETSVYPVPLTIEPTKGNGHEQTAPVTNDEQETPASLPKRKSSTVRRGNRKKATGGQ